MEVARLGTCFSYFNVCPETQIRTNLLCPPNASLVNTFTARNETQPKQRIQTKPHQGTNSTKWPGNLTLNSSETKLLFCFTTDAMFRFSSPYSNNLHTPAATTFSLNHVHSLHEGNHSPFFCSLDGHEPPI